MEDFEADSGYVVLFKNNASACLFFDNKVKLESWIKNEASDTDMYDDLHRIFGLSTELEVGFATKKVFKYELY